MSNRVSVVLLLLSLFWVDPAAAQVGSQKSPAWFLAVRDGQLTATINRVPLRLVLEALVRQVPLRLSVSGGWRDHLVTAHFRALPLDEAVAQLLAGLPYGIIYPPAPAGAGSAEKRPIGELLIFAKAPDVTSSTATGQGQEITLETTLGTTPEWTAALQHSDKAVRVEALQRWAVQGAATPLNPLTHALVDPDESVRAKAQELAERVWAEKAEDRAR